MLPKCRTFLTTSALGVIGFAPLTPGQSTVIEDADAIAAGASPTVIVTDRPLRTFQGQAVRVGDGAGVERSIGVVRPLRAVPTFDNRGSFDRANRFDRSDRWYFREIARGRILADAFVVPSVRAEESIGVVRAFRTFDPVVRNPPRVFTNPNATPSGGSADAGVDLAAPAEPVDVYSVNAVAVPAEVETDPWAMLNQGFYRAARAAFAEVREAGESGAAARTGEALAAALGGDVTAASELMPESPVLPAGVALDAATSQRLQATAALLFADDAALRRAVSTLLEAGAADKVPTAK
ncbi:MAG: hypothetical protein AAF710_11190 [Planctomycetota bacterium]